MMGELDSSEEGCRKEKHALRKEESFKGSDMKCSIGTVAGCRQTKVSQQFAAQIGQTFGLAMKKLVARGVETTCKEPPHPKKGGEEAAAIWKMQVKREKDRMHECDDEKEKAFSSIITRLESMNECKASEEVGDVAALTLTLSC